MSCHESEQNIILCGFQNVAPYLLLLTINLCADYLQIEKKSKIKNYRKNQPSLSTALMTRNKALEIWRDK